MAKTACEEAATILLSAIEEKLVGCYVSSSEAECDDVAKRLRGEGRKIVQYEKCIVGLIEGKDGSWFALFKHAKRIQKARKAK